MKEDRQKFLVRFWDKECTGADSPFQAVAGIENLIPGFEAKTAFQLFGSAIHVPSGDGEGGMTYDGRQDDGFALSTILTGPDFFQLFPHVWLAGSPAVLGQPGRIVLAESVARRYWGPDSVRNYLNRRVIYDDSLRLTVAGIVRDWDRPSDLNYTSFISISTGPNSWLRDRIPTTDWSSLQPRRSQAFVRLEKGVSSSRVDSFSVSLLFIGGGRGCGIGAGPIDGGIPGRAGGQGQSGEYVEE